MYVESSLDHWEKANLLLVAGGLFNRCLHLVYKYFIEIVSIRVPQGYWSVVLFRLWCLHLVWVLE